MIYLDTSVLVAATTREPKSNRVLAWLAQQRPGAAISDWTVTEYSSALSLKVRTKALGADDRAHALAHFSRLIADSFVVVPVTSQHFRIGARLADDHALNLRAGDALHVAIASEMGATLCTLDRQLAAACATLGVPTELI